MKTKFDTSHINIDLNTNLISGVWTNVSMADGDIQECGESEKVEKQTKKFKYGQPTTIRHKGVR